MDDPKPKERLLIVETLLMETKVEDASQIEAHNSRATPI
jgi:hypothetical protein